MERVDVTALRAVRTLVAEQPVTDAKIAFAWAIAAGPALGRASTIVRTASGLRVTPATDAWRRELVRAKPLLLDRLTTVLGPGVISTISIVAADDPTAMSRRPRGR
jgi:hypothetical protein